MNPNEEITPEEIQSALDALSLPSPTQLTVNIARKHFKAGHTMWSPPNKYGSSPPTCALRIKLPNGRIPHEPSCDLLHFLCRLACHRRNADRDWHRDPLRHRMFFLTQG